MYLSSGAKLEAKLNSLLAHMCFSLQNGRLWPAGCVTYRVETNPVENARHNVAEIY